MRQHLTHISTLENIDLPDYDIENVVAKVDTGAYSSAIWATHINEQDGVLSFKLFGPSHVYFNDELISTKKYSRVKIKNSFGQQEIRYKVEMNIKLADRIIKSNVTLANRSRNRYPVLIGRRTIRGKFLIDPSMNKTKKRNGKILLLSVHGDNEINKFTHNLQQQGLDIVSATYDDLIIRLGGEDSSIAISGTGEDISNFSLVFFKTSIIKGHIDIAAAVASYLANRHVEFIDQTVVSYPSTSKLFQYVYLTDRGISVPRTLFLSPKQLAVNYEKCLAELGTPFVLKNSLGSKGNDNYLIKSKNDFNHAIKQSNELGVWLLAQKYIENDHDYRLLVMGRRVVLVIQRSRLDKTTHLNNVAKGSQADLIDVALLPHTVVGRSVIAAQGLGLQVAGVDFVQDKRSKLWYCLEVNKAPQLYSGAFVEQKQDALVKYLHACLNNN